MDATQLKRRWAKLKERSRKRTCCAFEDFRQWYDSARKVCRYCGIEEEFLAKYLTRTKATLHFDRIDNHNGYVIGNIGLACHACNTGTKWCRSEIFTEIVLKAIMDAGLFGEYHLWYVSKEDRAEACAWHQFMSVEEGITWQPWMKEKYGLERRPGDRSIRIITPHEPHYVQNEWNADEPPEKSADPPSI